MTSTTDLRIPSHSNKEDLHSFLQQDLTKVFFDNGLDALANPSEINFLEMPTIDQPHSSTIRMSDSFLRSPYKQEANHHTDFLPYGFSPARSINSRGEDAYVFNFVQNSALCSPFKSDIKPKLNFSHKYSRDEFKNSANYQDEENIFACDFPNEESLSLMWNPDSNTKLKQEHNLADESKLQRKLEDDFTKNDFDYEDTFDSNLEDFSRRESLKKSNIFESYFDKKDDSEIMSMSHGLYPESTQDNTRFSANQGQDFIKISNRKAYYDSKKGYTSLENIDDYDPYQDNKGRSSHGLRVLSLRVKDVVAELGRTTYKEVADFITNEVSRKMSNLGARKNENVPVEKEEMNVKRRVYDALNVLIAASILRKDGKIVSCAEKTENFGTNKKKRLITEKENLNKIKNDILKKNRDKERAIQEGIFKLLAIRNLIRRNQEAEELNEKQRLEGDENTQSSAWSMTNLKDHQTQKVVQFPFLIVGASSEKNLMNLYMDKAKKRASIEAKSQLNIFGDTDVLFKMKLHHVSRDFFNEVLPQDMQKYVPSVYLERLK